MLADLRYGFRTLLRTKGWTAVVTISVALGIGANTATFSAVNGLLFRTLPIIEPDTLLRLRWSSHPAGSPGPLTSRDDYGYLPDGVGSTFPYAVFREFAAADQTTNGLLACAPVGDLNVVVNGEAEIVSGLLASGNYHQLLDVGAHLGRTLLPTDDERAAQPVAVISYRYWTSRFRGRADAVGTVIRINGVLTTIVGVEPRSFTGIQHAVSDPREITMPLAMEPVLHASDSRLEVSTAWWLQVAARTRQGIAAERVRLNLEQAFRRAVSDPGSTEGAPDGTAPFNKSTARLRVESASRGMYDSEPESLRGATILSAVVGLALLLVCANVSNLLLSRGVSRHKELATRLSLGATRARLIRQLLTESLMLAFIGGAFGLLIADWGRQLLPEPAPPLDWRVFAFSFAGTCLVGLGFGLLPAFKASGGALNTSLNDTSRALIGSRQWLSGSLIALQVAVSVVLVTGAGLFIRSVENLRQVDLGFDPRNMIVFRINPGLTRNSEAEILNIYERVRASVASVPGISGVALSYPAPLAGFSSETDVYPAGTTYTPSDRGRHVYYMTVSPDFFRVMKMPVLAGRGFTGVDRRDGPKVALVNETAARLYFNDRPIARRFGTFPGGSDFEIVGIVKDSRYNNLRSSPPPTVYVPFAQEIRPDAFVQARTAGEPMRYLVSVREAVRRVDANLPLANIYTQLQQIERRVAQERIFARACALFGALALLLASVGVFGLMSFSVTRRTNEIGIRMALGAQPTHVRRLIIRESLLPVSAGVVAGVAAALAAGRLVASLLFGVAAADIGAIAVSVATLVAAAVLAAYFPVQRASRIDPLAALRHD